MAATVAALETMIVRLTGDGAGYQRMLQGAQRNTLTFNQTINNQAQTTTSSFGGIASAIGAATVALGGFSLASRAVSLAAQTEMAETQFGTMLGSAERGSQMIRDLLQFAAETPLQMTDTQQAAQTLLQFGTAGADIIPTLRQLGDVTGGDAQRFNRMALAFGQMSSAGRLMGQDLLQMINAGFNPLQEMSRTTGRSMIDLKNDMSRGRISVDMVREAFRTATSEGGNYHNLMLQASRTTSGLFSTMQDDISAVLRQVGTDIIEGFALKDVMRSVSAFAKDALDWLKSLSPETKKIMMVIAAVATVVLGLVFIWPLLAAAVGTAFSAISGMFAFFGTWTGMAILDVTRMGAVYAQAFGGIMAVFGKAKSAFMGMIAVFRGGAGALRGLVGDEHTGGQFAVTMLGYWQTIKDAANVAWSYIQLYVGLFVAWALPKVTALVNSMVSLWGIVWSAAVDAWGYVTTAVSDFVAWAAPIFLAWVGVLQAAWGIVVEAASFAWDAIVVIVQTWWSGVQAILTPVVSFVSGIWTSIFGSASTSWSSIQTTIMDALILAEFLLTNFKEVAAMVWTGVKLDALTAFNVVAFFFTDTMPAALEWLGSNWRNVFTDMFNFTQQAFTNMGANASNFWSNIRRALTGGSVDWSAGWTSMTAGMQSSMTQLVLPTRVPSDQENALRQEYEQMGEQLGASFADFRNRRLQEIGDVSLPRPEEEDVNEAATWLTSPALPRVAYQAGQQAGASMRQGAQREVQRFDAVSMFSAEAMSRVQAHLDRVNGMTGQNPTVIPTQMASPTLPQVNVPGHSLYDLYDLPTIQVALEFIPPDTGDALAEAEDAVTAVEGIHMGGIAGMFQQLSAQAAPGTVFTIPDVTNIPSSMSELMSWAGQPRTTRLTDSADPLGALLGGDDEDDMGTLVGAVVPTRVSTDEPVGLSREADEALPTLVDLFRSAVDHLGQLSGKQLLAIENADLGGED